MEMAELVSAVNNLREKQLNGGGLNDDEVRQGISLIVQIRRLRAGTKGQIEVPGILQGKLEDLF